MIRGSDIPLVFGAAALLLGAASFIWLILLEWRMRRLFRGTRVSSLERLLGDMIRELESVGKKNTATDAAVAHIETRLKNGAHNFGLVRFNPYADAGGDQSFALAVVNEHKNGFVLSSLFHRDGTRIYAKPLASGKSTYALSAEEQEAIEQALNLQNSVKQNHD